MRGRGNRCHTEVVDADGWSEDCGKPQAGTISAYDDYGRKYVYPVCEQCATAAMEGIDDD